MMESNWYLFELKRRTMVAHIQRHLARFTCGVQWCNASVLIRIIYTWCQMTLHGAYCNPVSSRSLSPYNFHSTLTYVLFHLFIFILPSAPLSFLPPSPTSSTFATTLSLCIRMFDIIKAYDIVNRIGKVTLSLAAWHGSSLWINQQWVDVRMQQMAFCSNNKCFPRN